MDGSCFDLWTRRRFGLAAGGGLAALAGLAGVGEAKRRKQRCRKPGQACGKGKRCCGNLACDTTPGGPGRFCCQELGAACANDKQCCGDQLLCSDRIGVTEFFCCGITDAPCGGTGDCCGSLVCDAGSCKLPSSDRALKANFAAVDPADVLHRVRALPVTTWSDASDETSVRHIGPPAPDFATIFGVGADDRHIHPIDGQGVALAAIQALAAQIATVRAENDRLAARIALLEEG